MNRVDIVREAVRRGDIGLCLGDTSGKTENDIMESAANVLDLIKAGRYTKMQPINDSKGRKVV